MNWALNLELPYDWYTSGQLRSGTPCLEVGGPACGLEATRKTKG